ncbi:MAG: type II 3-dehydroquinate dehydratase, partial [Pseudomonadota bacterium]
FHGHRPPARAYRADSDSGHETLAEIDALLIGQAQAAGIELEAFQSNAEHELVERIQATREQGIDGIVINPAAFTHTSVALRDALAAVRIPFVEVHLSQPETREPFRHRSYLADLALGRVSGFGAQSYALGLAGLIQRLQ